MYIEPEKVSFMKEYYQLCKKHDMWIDSCGCCESPWIEKRIKTDVLYAECAIEHLIDYHITCKNDVRDFEVEKLLKEITENEHQIDD